MLIRKLKHLLRNDSNGGACQFVLLLVVFRPVVIPLFQHSRNDLSYVLSLLFKIHNTLPETGFLRLPLNVKNDTLFLNGALW